VSPTLLVRLDRSEIPVVLRRFHRVDFFDERDLAGLVQAIRTALLDRLPCLPRPHLNAFSGR
jgi:hypothetical protein